MTIQNKKEKLLELKSIILHETKNVASFVSIGETLHTLYYKDKLVKNQREFLEWTKNNLGFSKSTTYEYIISFRVYSDIIKKLPPTYKPPMYQSHCQLLAKIPEDQVADVWIEVNDSAPNGVITTAVLENYLASKNYSVTKKSPRKPQKRKASLKRKQYSESEEDEAELLSEPEPENWPTNRTPESSSTELLLPVEQTPPKKRFRNRQFNEPIPFEFEQSSSITTSSPHIDIFSVFECARRVVDMNGFDIVCHHVDEFLNIEHDGWNGGRIFANLSSAVPFSTRTQTTVDQSRSTERLLQTIFTRFTNKDYSEGIFCICAEFGADWFTPILQQPFCILRQRRVETPFESFVCFYLGPNVQEFSLSFKSVGIVPGINSWCWLQPFSSPTRQRVESKEIDFHSEFLNVPCDSQPLEESAATALCHIANC